MTTTLCGLDTSPIHEHASDCYQPRAATIPVDKFGRGQRCERCDCTSRWRDLSAVNPIEDWCSEPDKWRPDDVRCYCHSPAFIEGYLGGAV